MSLNLILIWFDLISLDSNAFSVAAAWKIEREWERVCVECILSDLGNNNEEKKRRRNECNRIMENTHTIHNSSS